MGIAGIIAIGSTVLLVKEVWNRIFPTHFEYTGLTADEAFWLAIRDSEAPALFEEFLKKFPTSAHVKEAHTQIEQIKKKSKPEIQNPTLPTDVRAGPGNQHRTISGISA